MVTKDQRIVKINEKKNVARLNLTFERNIKRICETTNLFHTSKSFPMLDIICPHYTKYSNRHPINLYRFDVSRCTMHPSINCYRSYDDTGTVHKYNRRFSVFDIIRKLRKEFLTSGTLNWFERNSILSFFRKFHFTPHKANSIHRGIFSSA